MPALRQTALRLAESITSKPLDPRAVSATLLPPKPLYRRILRAHRGLPHDMRSLGDVYIKSEFRLHRKVTEPVYIMGFLSQWKMYLDGLPKNTEEEYTGRKLDSTVYEKMSPEQLGQLYEVMNAAKDVWKPGK
ncbi:hypothetical protein BDV98DRAFT_571038 [Pterulicium gracile]|uniref:Succinate dehydrogenase assembly factor 3 n=1 Tax=Pterulicium gracile TaxID=1884261 RepID=A0A5C3QBQ1_9AGAR|nr:hypothetical protein BDV98DRAFT_571038 [Pterula gracilis]